MIDLRVPSPLPRLAYFSRIIYTCDGNRFILQLLAEYSESKEVVNPGDMASPRGVVNPRDVQIHRACPTITGAAPEMIVSSI